MVKYLYLGRVISIFEHNTGKHAWISAAQSRAKLSYVSLEIYQYNLGQTIIQAAHQQEFPMEWTFSHLPIKFVVYVYNPQDDDPGFACLGPGNYRVPDFLVELIATCPEWQRCFVPKSTKKMHHKRVKKDP